MVTSKIDKEINFSGKGEDNDAKKDGKDPKNKKKEKDGYMLLNNNDEDLEI